MQKLAHDIVIHLCRTWAKGWRTFKIGDMPLLTPPRISVNTRWNRQGTASRWCMDQRHRHPIHRLLHDPSALAVDSWCPASLTHCIDKQHSGIVNTVNIEDVIRHRKISSSTSNFYPRHAMLVWIFAIATCPSVCPSVTCRYCVKTKKASVMISSLSGIAHDSSFLVPNFIIKF